MSASKVKAATNAPVSLHQVQSIISSDPTLIYRKHLHTLLILPAHKAACITFAWWYIANQQLWNTIVYSDEKCFNLDGPDGFHYYWHDIWRELQLYLMQQQGGGGVMAWAAFCATGKLSVVFCDTNVNSTAYTQILQENLLLFAANQFCGNFLFQQDNAPVHKSWLLMEWFNQHNIQLVPWPARLPDLNPMENLWGLLARLVYENGCWQFATINSLKAAIVQCWAEIEVKMLVTLAQSMVQRSMDILQVQGAKTGY